MFIILAFVILDLLAQSTMAVEYTDGPSAEG